MRGLSCVVPGGPRKATQVKEAAQGLGPEGRAGCMEDPVLEETGTEEGSGFTFNVLHA